MIGDAIELIRAFSRDIQDHSVAIFTLAVILMLMHINSLRRKVRRVDDRQDECDTVSAVIQESQANMKESLARIEGTLDRHDRDERGFWKEVRGFINGGGKKNGGE